MSNIPVNVPLSAQQRDAKNALAFIDHVGEVTGRKMRPPSLYSLNAMRILGLVKADEDGKVVKNEQVLPQDVMDAYMFIHAAPVPDVSRAVRKFSREAGTPEAWEAFMNEDVAPFLATLSPEAVESLQDELESMDEIEAAQVNAKPPEREGKAESPDPNC